MIGLINLIILRKARRRSSRTIRVQIRRLFVRVDYKHLFLWSRWSGLNRLPRPYQGRALPFELQRPDRASGHSICVVDREGFEPSYLARRDRFTVCWL